MNIEEMLDINDCPLCDGGALLEEECGCGYYVMCMECGCHSVTIDFHSFLFLHFLMPLQKNRDTY